MTSRGDGSRRNGGRPRFRMPKIISDQEAKNDDEEAKISNIEDGIGMSS